MHPNSRTYAPQQGRVRRQAEQSDAYAFFSLLTSPALLDESWPMKSIPRNLPRTPPP